MKKHITIEETKSAWHLLGEDWLEALEELDVRNVTPYLK